MDHEEAPLRQLCRGMTVLLMFGVGSTSGARGQECEIPRPMTAHFLMTLEEIPQYGGGDPCFWEVVDFGLPVLSELTDLLDDPTITRHTVPLFGGRYAVGDIALRMIQIIVLLPVVDLLPNEDPESFDNCGYCVYWKFVREKPANREALKANIEKWISDHFADLRWVDAPSRSNRGYFAVLEEPDPS